MALVRPIYLSATLAKIPASTSDDDIQVGGAQFGDRGIALGGVSAPGVKKIIGLDVAEAGSASGEGLSHSQTSAAILSGALTVAGVLTGQTGASISGGALAMNSQQITGLAAGSGAGHAARYEQVVLADGTNAMSGALAMGNNKITGLGTPTTTGDAATKEYIDQKVVQGGSVREAVLLADQLDPSDGMMPAAAIFFDANPVDGDTVVTNDGTTTRTYYFGTGSGDVQVTIGGTAAASMQNLATAIDGDGQDIGATFSTDLDAINSAGVVVLTGVPGATCRVYGTWATQANCQFVNYSSGYDYTLKTSGNLPSSDPSAVNFGPERALGSLMDGEIHYALASDVQYSWDDSSNAWQTLSGTGSTPVATSGSGGGTQGKLTMDSDYGLSITGGVAKIEIGAGVGLEFASGLLGLKSDSATGGNTVELSIVANGVGLDVSGIVDASTIEADGSGNLRVKDAGIVAAKIAAAVAGNGLTGGAGSALSVDPDSTTGGNTVAVAVGANGVGLDVSGIVDDSTIEADGSGNLRVKDNGITAAKIAAAVAGGGLSGGGGSALAVSLAATGGLELDGDDVQVKIASANELSSDASGLAVAGVPTEFKIGASAVSSDVTAANLNTLVGDVSADALHLHDDMINTADWLGNAAIAVKKVLRIVADGKLGIGDIDTEAASRITGVCSTACSADNGSIGIQRSGLYASAGTGWTFNVAVYSDTNGDLTQSVPGSGKWATRIGYAASTTDLLIDIQELGQVP